MSAHPAPFAMRSIRAETAGSSGLALGPNQRGKAAGEGEASMPVMAMARSAPDEGSAGEPILLDGRSCHACAARGVWAVSPRRRMRRRRRRRAWMTLLGGARVTRFWIALLGKTGMQMYGA